MATIDDCGPKISEGELASFEAGLGSRLPAGYREFLLASNGGVPTPDGIDVPGLPGTPSDVQVLFGVRRSEESSSLTWNLAILADRLETGLLPIARDSEGGVFCLSLRPRDTHAVVYCDLQWVFADHVSRPESYFVAPDFESFLGKLRSLP